MDEEEMEMAGGSTKLFLGGLSWETTEEKLQAHFAKYGDIMEVIVMRDRATSKPRGFGFITFRDEAAASRACQEVHTLDGRTIDAKPSVPQGEGSRPRSKKIFVGGLAPDTTEDQFKEYFERYGKTAEAQIMVDHTSGRSRGFGFITFEEESAVEKVFAAGSMHDLGGKKVEVKNATPKGSGPQGGRGAGRGLFPGRGPFPGRGAFGEYGQVQPGYNISPPAFQMPGYGMVSGYGYGGMPPYGAYPGMVMSGYGAYGSYGGYFPQQSAAVAGFPSPTAEASGRYPQPQYPPQQQPQQQPPQQQQQLPPPQQQPQQQAPPGRQRQPQQQTLHGHPPTHHQQLLQQQQQQQQ